MSTKCTNITKKLDVSILGRTNSGKSTLINTIMNRKISAESPKSHTTTRIIRGIYTTNNTQIVFLDTPGIDYISGSTRNNEIAKTAIINKTDHLNVFVFPANKFLEDRIINFSKHIDKENKLALITKIDTVRKPRLLPMTNRLHELGFEHILYFSIKDPKCIIDFKNFLMSRAIEGEWAFPESIQTDNSMNALLIEATKEILFHQLYEELPYEIRIFNDNIKVNDNGEYIIYQSLEVKKNAHHIVLGRIKELSMSAAKNMQSFLQTDKKVHLYLNILNKTRNTK